MFNLIQNNEARSTVVAAIEAAHTKTRKTKTGFSRARGAIVYIPGEYIKSPDKLAIVGDARFCVITVPANSLNDDVSDMLCFYVNGVLVHEEVHSVDAIAWFKLQASRA